MNAALSSFLYVFSAFSLMGLIVLLILLGSHFGEPGAIVGAIIGVFIMTWAACYFLS